MKKLIMSGIVLAMLGLPLSQAIAASQMTCWFPPGWANKPEKAREITKALSDDSGITLRPRIAKSYPEILSAFATKDENLVYVGSFAQAIIKARGLGKALVQSTNGKELYSGILIYPAGQNPQDILKQHPTEIAYAIGASSGESTAKAATNGKAAIGTPNHGASCGAVKAGKAKAAVVKNWWWETNKGHFPELRAYEIPKFSKRGNPDNVLTASNAVSVADQQKIVAAAMKNRAAFGAEEIRLFEDNALQFSLWLMEQGKIDPLTYNW